MKRTLQRLLQARLGLPRYLDLFAAYRLAVSRLDPADAPFRAFLRHLPEEGIVLDVGANVGVMTVRLARHMQPGIVHAFEPNPFARGAAARLVGRRRLSNVLLHDCALGSRSGEVELLMPVDDRVSLHGLSRVATEGVPDAAGRRFRAPCRTLDDFDEFFAPEARVVGIKLDVEDSEADVLEGARRLLATHRPLVYCELWLTPNRDRAVSLMGTLGYEARVYHEEALEPFVPLRHASAQDFFFVPTASP